ncbi:MAG TPA: phosphohydrolase [Planctomycetaceae bacterium]|nr:phosphohydrolase [Planctomycetaceae bacterium]
MAIASPAEKIDFEELLANVQLPALPQTAITLLELSQDSSNGPAEFARPIEADAGLMTQILRFVNSSYFGFASEITNIRQALALVGVRTIKNFALWSAVFSLVPDPKFGAFNLQKLWQDSLRRAVFARILARSIKLANAEELFSAALLQDMAIPLLLKELPEHYETLIERRSNENLRLSKLEQEAFGWDHGQVAAALVRNWRLPEEFARLIEFHPNFDELMNQTPPAREAACVALAALLPSCEGEQWAERDQFLDGLRRISSASYSSLKSIIDEADRTFETFAPMMRLSVPERTLQEWLQS